MDVLEVPKIEFAVYGALKENGKIEGMDVTTLLNGLILVNAGVVQINNNNMTHDPSRGFQKQFYARVSRKGLVHHYVCSEGQTINFNHGGFIL